MNNFNPDLIFPRHMYMQYSQLLSFSQYNKTSLICIIFNIYFKMYRSITQVCRYFTKYYWYMDIKIKAHKLIFSQKYMF